MQSLTNNSRLVSTCAYWEIFYVLSSSETKLLKISNFEKLKQNSNVPFRTFCIRKKKIVLVWSDKIM